MQLQPWRQRLCSSLVAAQKVLLFLNWPQVSWALRSVTHGHGHRHEDHAILLQHLHVGLQLLKLLHLLQLLKLGLLLHLLLQIVRLEGKRLLLMELLLMLLLLVLPPEVRVDALLGLVLAASLPAACLHVRSILQIR